ncbi:MAG: MaoC/PaaZ C-terminal domain-containing protein [Acidimicrobiales bacterium]
MKFEEAELGQLFTTRRRRVGLTEIVEYAKRYDPLPIHVDREFARRGPFGDIIAPGMLGLSVAWGLWTELGIFGEDALGGIAVGNARFHRPLVVDDEVHAIVEIVEHRITSKGRGLVTVKVRLFGSAGEVLLEFDTTGLQRRLDDGIAPGRSLHNGHVST